MYRGATTPQKSESDKYLGQKRKSDKIKKINKIAVFKWVKTYEFTRE